MLVAVTFQRRHVDCPLPLGKKITFLIWIGRFIIKKPINCKSSYRFVYEGLIQRVPRCVSHDYSKLIAIPSRVWCFSFEESYIIIYQNKFISPNYITLSHSFEFDFAKCSQLRYTFFLGTKYIGDQTISAYKPRFNTSKQLFVAIV